MTSQVSPYASQPLPRTGLVQIRISYRIMEAVPAEVPDEVLEAILSDAVGMFIAFRDPETQWFFGYRTNVVSGERECFVDDNPLAFDEVLYRVVVGLSYEGDKFGELLP